MATNITTVSGKGAPLNSTEFDNNLVGLKNTADEALVRIMSLENGTTKAGEAVNAESAVNSDNAEKLAGMLPGSGADSILHTDADGNVGIGTESYNWNPDWTALDIKDAALIDTGNTGAHLSANAYYDGTNWRYKSNGAASCLVQFDGKYIFRKASTGLAGEVITWTESLNINADGNVETGGRLIFKALTSESLGYSSIKRTGTEDVGAILELLSESGSRFKVQKNGNIGIGTDSPEYPLHIKSEISCQVAIECTKTGGNKWRLISRHDGALGFYDSNAADYQLFLFQGGGAQFGEHTKGGDLLVNGKSSNRCMKYDESENRLSLSTEYNATGSTSWGIQGRHRYNNNWRHMGLRAVGSAIYLANGYVNYDDADILSGKMLVFDYNGGFFPYEDGNQYLGRSNNKWSTVYAATGSIHTSDARLKTEVQGLTPDELNASKQLAKEIGTFKFLQSVEEKGDSARKHIGMTVQRAIEIMEANNLNPFEYGFICYDEWEEETIEHPAVEAQDAEYDNEDNEISPAIEAKDSWTETNPAGDCYSFRYDELNQFILAGISARLDALED